MSDDIEARLRHVTPRGAPPELRPRVLAAVADELDSVAPPGPFRSPKSPLSPRERVPGGRVRGCGVEEETAPVSPPRRSPRLGLAVAAALLFGLALNVLVADTLDRRLAVVLGPRPVPRQAAEIAAEIASITDLATGRWAFERLAAGRPRGDDARRYVLRLRQMIRQFTVDLEETADETPEKNPQMDRDRRGSRDRHPAAAQRVLRLEHRNTA